MTKKEYYTLQDAIEWIVFRKDSKDVTAEMLNMNLNNIALAETALLNAIKSHKIQLIGQHDEYNPEEFINCFTNAISIYPASNVVTIDHIHDYMNIKIEKKAFQTQYPPATASPSSTKSNKYTTPYLEIIAEVIWEEKITNKNQSKAEVLTHIILNKMTERGLSPSKKIAEAMTSIIRLPESQKGKAKKG